MPNSTEFDLNLIGSARAARKLQDGQQPQRGTRSIILRRIGSINVIRPNGDTVGCHVTGMANERREKRSRRRR